MYDMEADNSLLDQAGAGAAQIPSILGWPLNSDIEKWINMTAAIEKVRHDCLDKTPCTE